MTKIWVTAHEWFPVETIHDEKPDGYSREHDVPQELIDRYNAAQDAFVTVEQELADTIGGNGGWH